MKEAFKLSIPTLFAYFPLGIVFAVLWLKAGFNAYLAPITSVFVYAGAVQFAAVSMMQEHASLLAIVLAAAFIASRNIFYGLTLVERFKKKPKFMRLFLIFGLVDASYAILMTNPEKPGRDDTKFCFYVSFFPYIYWVSGTVLGVFLSAHLPDFKGIDFMLTSFYMILVTDYYLISRDKISLFMPILFALISYILLPQQYLLVSILFSAFFIYGHEAYKEKGSSSLKGDIS